MDGWSGEFRGGTGSNLGCDIERERESLMQKTKGGRFFFCFNEIFSGALRHIYMDQWYVVLIRKGFSFGGLSGPNRIGFGC